MEQSSVAKNLNINVGTRKSQLALEQTDLVVGKLVDFYLNNPDRLEQIVERHQQFGRYQAGEPKIEFNVIAMSTKGDEVQDKSLIAIGSKSLFTRELEVALLDGRLDFVVHSLKDLPTSLPEGCVVGAIMQRADPEDAIVLTESLKDHINPIDLLLGRVVQTQEEKFKIGTSSQRRIAMINRCNPNLDCIDIRGSLNTRLEKLDDISNNYTAIILAKAGLDRLGMSDRVSSVLTPKEDPGLHDWCYAVGQGAIAVECRSNDQFTLELLEPIVDIKTTYETIAERSFMKKLEGGCSTPLGVRSTWVTSGEKKALNLETIVLSRDGKSTVRASGKVTLLGQEDEKTSSSIIEPCPTGITLSRVALASASTKHNITRCSDLGMEVANKMIELGCLELFDRGKHYMLSIS